MNVGTLLVMKAQVFPYFPVPVGTKTITPAKPDTEHKPGKSGQQKRDQIPPPRLAKQPAGDIKKCKNGMKNKKENIQQCVPHELGNEGYENNG